GLNFATCARAIEKRLGALASITQVDASYVSQTVTITYDETRLSENVLRACVQDCGFGCGEPLTATDLLAATHDSAAPAAPQHDTHMMAESATHAEEMEHQPAAEAYAAHPGPHAKEPDQSEQAEHSRPSGPAGMAPQTMERAGARQDRMPGMAHGGHGMHDMSDPAMARAMEADMRRRFWVALALTIPIVLYSSLGTEALRINVPVPFGLSRNWLLLLLTTPVVGWCGWIFHSGAWRALRNHSLDMNVLVSLGVLVGYLFSAFATLFAPGVATSFDAAAMLVTFVLFGHWMEMRSRRGSSDALNALLKLAPSQANVIDADGSIATKPVEQVEVSDLLLLRPGERVPVDGTVERVEKWGVDRLVA